MTRVLFVAVEPPWPAVQGGRVRMARLVESLAKVHDVTVVTWSATHEPHGFAPPDVLLKILRPDSGVTKLRGFASSRPRIVRQIAGRAGEQALVREVGENDYAVVMFSHTYLAAGLPDLGLPTVLDLANREHSRYRQFAKAGSWTHRASATIEYWKALRWEPRAVAAAEAVSVLSSEDQVWVESVGGNPILVPLGVSAEQPATASPADGPALFLGSMDYRPNLEGAKFLVDDVWPRVRDSLPEAELVIAGRRSLATLGAQPGEGIRVLGEVDSVTAAYEQAAVFLAPVASGAGRQLKVLEALSYGRAIVCSPYSAQSVPDALRERILVGADPVQFAQHVVTLLRDIELRRRWESDIVAASGQLPTWDAVVRPLAEFLGRLA